MNKSTLIAGFSALALTAPGFAGDNPDFRIRADFRTPDNGEWAADTSVGHATFLVVSRFGQVYYGGVIRMDEYRFTLQLDFTEGDDYQTEFGGSVYNTNYDAYIHNQFIGRLMMNNIEFAVGELQYDSRHPTPPALPLPANFPEPIDAGDLVTVFFAAPTLPAFGAPMPAGDPIFAEPLLEEFARGDTNQDGEVDLTDFSVLASHFDPFHLNGPHVGPLNGDFSADNLSDTIDYEVLVANWSGNDDPPAAPAATALPGDMNCDAFVTVGDIGGFVTAITNPQQYVVQYPGCNIARADVNLDGFVTVGDIGSFVSLITGG